MEKEFSILLIKICIKECMKMDIHMVMVNMFGKTDLYIKGVLLKG
mgnify:CR=1 FL=1